MPENGGQWRYLCSELVRVDYEATPGIILELDANLEEISSSTAILLVDVSVRKGRPVSFQVQDRQMRGVVDSWVYEPPLGYFVSIRFDGGYEWHEEQFHPSHLLKVARSARAKSQTS